jgi:hypothetical protein
MQIDNYKESKMRPGIFSRNNLITKIINFIQNSYTTPENQSTIIFLFKVLKGIMDESENNLEEMQVFFLFGFFSSILKLSI